MTVLFRETLFGDDGGAEDHDIYDEQDHDDYDDDMVTMIMVDDDGDRC